MLYQGMSTFEPEASLSWDGVSGSEGKRLRSGISKSKPMPSWLDSEPNAPQVPAGSLSEDKLLSRIMQSLTAAADGLRGVPS